MRLLLLALSILLVPSIAQARTHRVDQLPYGERFGCTSCHVSAAGGGVFTGFGSHTIRALVGSDLVQERDLDWSQVYHLDSDRDGFTNGEEVYDPDGNWTIGDPNPVGGVPFNPGDPDSHPFSSCGDGRVTPPEECDGTNHRELTCIGLGLEEGPLVCNPDCTFDRSGCGGAPEEEPTTEDEPAPVDGVDDDAACAVTRQGKVPPLVWLMAILLLGWRRRRQGAGHA